MPVYCNDVIGTDYKAAIFPIVDNERLRFIDLLTKCPGIPGYIVLVLIHRCSRGMCNVIATDVPEALTISHINQKESIVHLSSDSSIESAKILCLTFLPLYSRVRNNA